jgi:tRNA threonylcarbamoyladenosine modification (KEOPS) complex  Pcc1 subunit
MTGVDPKRVKCVLEIEFASSSEAEKVHRSVQLDNEGYLDSRVDGKTLRAEVEAESLKSLLHTLDDFMACLSVAYGIVVKDR